jgi:hypothetical protein
MYKDWSPGRKLANNFFQLSFYKRLEIGRELGLGRDDDSFDDHKKLSITYLTRASEMGILGQLWETVEKRLGHLSQNPFAGR